MATEHTTKILDYTVDVCPKCGGKHDFKLKALVKVEPDEEIVLFAGKGGKKKRGIINMP